MSSLYERLVTCSVVDVIHDTDDNWSTDLGCDFCPGQVWTVVDLPTNMPRLSLLVLKKIGDVAYMTPIHRWQELAGPRDVIMTEEVFNVKGLVVALSVRLQVSRRILGRCLGRFTPKVMEHINRAENVSWKEMDSHLRDPFEWGPELCKPVDCRSAYHYQIRNVFIMRRGVWECEILD